MLETNSYAGDLRTRPAIPAWRMTGGAVEANEGETRSDNLEKVDHVVVVMLENRSFDHMLGYLSLSGRRPEIDGLRPGLANEYQGRAYLPHHLAATAVQMDPDHSSVIKTILMRFCPRACDPPHARERRSRLSMSPHYPGLRVAQASHLGELLTRGTPRPAPPRDALVRQAAVRADRTGAGQPRTGQEESGNHPLNDLQESILAAAHQLRADGHPPNTP